MSYERIGPFYVNNLMGCHSMFRIEAFPTDPTGIWLLSCVNTHMSLKMPICVETLPTKATRMFTWLAYSLLSLPTSNIWKRLGKNLRFLQTYLSIKTVTHYRILHSSQQYHHFDCCFSCMSLQLLNGKSSVLKPVK